MHIKISFDVSVQGNLAAEDMHVFRNHEDNIILAGAKGLGKATIPTARKNCGIERQFSQSKRTELPEYSSDR
ncbi:hypothetical protein ACLB2K_006124 [Fragaria x ananassa]